MKGAFIVTLIIALGLIFLGAYSLINVRFTGNQILSVEETPTNVSYVNMNANRFEPQTLTITVGTTVEWANFDKTPHTVTALDGSFDSGEVPEGSTYSHTFTKPGTYKYRCKFHKGMTGTIFVK